MYGRRLVSAIVPVFNGERFIAEALRSVLDQRYAPLEVVVVDDGSTDRGARIARHVVPEVSYVRQEHSGSGAARNRGAELARGRYLAFLDADDLWFPGKLTRQVAALEIEPSLDGVCGHVEHFYSPELDARSRASLACPPGLLPGYHCGALLIRKAAFWRVGRFDVGLRAGEVVDWFVRAREQGLSIAMLPDAVLRRRIHAGNFTLHHRDALRDYLKVVKASLERRRADQAAASLPKSTRP